MSSTTLTPDLTAPERRRLRHGGWLLIGSFAGFVVALAAIILTGLEYDAALVEAAEQRGVGINDLPAEVIAPINHEYNDLPSGILTLVLILLAHGLYVAGVRRTTAGQGNLGRAAVAAACGMPLCWLAIYALEYAIGIDEPGRWIEVYDAAYDPVVATNTVAGSLALLGVVVVLRRARVARRTGAVVGVLAVLLIVAAVVYGAPPVVPLLLAAIVGIVMVRTARTAVTG